MEIYYCKGGKQSSFNLGEIVYEKKVLYLRSNYDNDRIGQWMRLKKGNA
jgi:hypothetical protein